MNESRTKRPGYSTKCTVYTLSANDLYPTYDMRTIRIPMWTDVDIMMFRDIHKVTSKGDNAGCHR
jgi:hypothetical protein